MPKDGTSRDDRRSRDDKGKRKKEKPSFVETQEMKTKFFSVVGGGSEELAMCTFNATHVVRMSELQEHETHCPDRNLYDE